MNPPGSKPEEPMPLWQFLLLMAGTALFCVSLWYFGFFGEVYRVGANLFEKVPYMKTITHWRGTDLTIKMYTSKGRYADVLDGKSVQVWGEINQIVGDTIIIDGSIVCLPSQFALKAKKELEDLKWSNVHVNQIVTVSGQFQKRKDAPDSYEIVDCILRINTGPASTEAFFNRENEKQHQEIRKALAVDPAELLNGVIIQNDSFESP